MITTDKRELAVSDGFYTNTMFVKLEQPRRSWRVSLIWDKLLP